METSQIDIKNLEASVKLYSISKSASLLGLGREKLLTLIENGEINSVTIGGRKRISLGELLRFTSKSNHKHIPISTIDIRNSDVPKRSTTRIDKDKINEIFNNIKKEVMDNEKTKKTNIS